MDTNRILKENEIEANRVQTRILLVTLGIVVITWILFETGFFYIRVQFRELMISNILLLAVAAATSRYFKYEKPWIKYILMGVMTIVFAVTTSALTYNVTLLITIPILLSIRYFNKKYTIFIAILSIIVFYLAYLYGANHGMLDMNFVQYAPGTTIVTNDKMWLDDAVRDIPYDSSLMLFNTTVSDYFVKLLQYIIISVASVALVGCCQKLMQKQKDLTESTARIGAELELAEKIQRDMLPSIFPTFSEQKEYDLYATMTTAREVGGDFYDFFKIDDDHLAMVMADVSGKGVPAALFMMASKIILQSVAMLGGSPAEILTKTNQAICSNNQEEMFVTVWVGILEISTGKLTAANAGHEYPVIQRGSDGRFEIIKDKHGLVIGAMDGVSYREYELHLEPGSKLFLYTDGVPEATNAENELYGLERMLDALNTDRQADPQRVLHNVRVSVDAFVKDATQFDDITMLCMEYKGKEAETPADLKGETQDDRS